MIDTVAQIGTAVFPFQTFRRLGGFPAEVFVLRELLLTEIQVSERFLSRIRVETLRDEFLYDHLLFDRQRLVMDRILDLLGLDPGPDFLIIRICLQQLLDQFLTDPLRTQFAFKLFLRE